MRSMSILMGLLVIACCSTAALAAQQDAQAVSPEPELVVPAGTVFPVVLNTYLNTRNTQPGDIFYADTSYPIWIQQRLIIPRGSIVKGVVTQVEKPGTFRGKGRMTIKFDTILLPNGVERELIADFHGIHGPGAEKIDRKTETVEQGGSANTGADIGTVVGTAGEGAMIGGIASRGGAKGAGIGAGAGAATGVAIVLLSRERNLVLEPGTQLDLQLSQPLRFAYGEVLFTDSQIRKAPRTPVARPSKPEQKRRGIFGFPGFGFPRIWR
jgi:hypothetical protein